jgi:hypothetical protein
VLPLELLREAVDELDTLRRRPDAICSTENLRCRYKPDLGTGEMRLEAIDPVVDVLHCCRMLAEHVAVLAPVVAIYGEPGCLFKDKLVLKPPGVAGYGLHQDWIAWPGFPRTFLTVLVPFDSANVENGCTIAYRGYHHHGSLSAEDGQYHELPPLTVDEGRAVPLELDPGDIAIFGGFTPHRSALNQSGRWRRQLFLSYNALSDGGAFRDAHYEQFQRWLLDRLPAARRAGVYFR